NLREAERSFRDLKTTLELRPVFHRLENRPTLHIVRVLAPRATRDHATPDTPPPPPPPKAPPAPCSNQPAPPTRRAPSSTRSRSRRHPGSPRSSPPKPTRNEALAVGTRLPTSRTSKSPANQSLLARSRAHQLRN